MTTTSDDYDTYAGAVTFVAGLIGNTIGGVYGKAYGIFLTGQESA